MYVYTAKNVFNGELGMFTGNFIFLLVCNTVVAIKESVRYQHVHTMFFFWLYIVIGCSEVLMLQ